MRDGHVPVDGLFLAGVVPLRPLEGQRRRRSRVSDARERYRHDSCAMLLLRMYLFLAVSGPVQPMEIFSPRGLLQTTCPPPVSLPARDLLRIAHRSVQRRRMVATV